MTKSPIPQSQPETFSHTRLKDEFKTLRAMVFIYCRGHHTKSGVLCQECEELLSYAQKRLLHCPFQEKKPTCGKCTVHCYKKSMQERVKKVMKYAGPKMIFHHPIMALTHLLDGRRKIPTIK